MTKTAASTASSSLNRWRAAVAAAALGAFVLVLGARGWVRDDRWLIADNPVFRRGWAAAPAVLVTGYVEAVMGAAAPIKEYRPLLSLSFLAQLATTGKDPLPFHAVDLLLHAAVCLLLFALLRERLGEKAAGIAAVLFAVMPVHAEVVAYITSRSELLTALSLLLTWRFLGARREQPRLLPGLACFAAGLLSKESAFVIPAFLALADWSLDGRKPWDEGRRLVYAGLVLVAGLVWAWRGVVLGPGLSAGVPFFARRLDAAVVWPAFALKHYVWPSLSGVGLCADFTSPVSTAVTAARVAALVVVPGGALAALVAALRRRAWGFWLAGPALFLLPTCPLLVPLDTLGAERFLYIPTMGLAALLGPRLARLPRAAWLALAAWWFGALQLRNRVWVSERNYYESALACNPSSARARSGLGVALLLQGDRRGADLLLEAARLDPKLPDPPYNLAQLAWRSGDMKAAEGWSNRALARDPKNADAWVLLAISVEPQGRRYEAEGALRKALDIMPWHALAEFNLGRMLLLDGREREAEEHFARFVALAPDDPDARRLAASLEKRRNGAP